MAQTPGRWGGTTRALDVDERSLVPVGCLRFHAAPLPSSDPAVPVEFGIAAQPFRAHAVIETFVVEAAVVGCAEMFPEVTASSWQAVLVMVTRLSLSR